MMYMLCMREGIIGNAALIAACIAACIAAWRPHLPPDITGLADEVCLACMPGFRAGGALGGPGQPSVNFTGKLSNLGAHAP
eukprot:1162114-Pelagomonas_calceolata.AAC.4